MTPVPENGDGFVRRVAAVVVVIITVPGEEGAAAIVAQAQEIVRAVMRAGRGDAEPLAADTVVAGFLDVTSALDAVLGLPERLAAAEGASRAVARIGVHAGDVLLTPEGSAFAEAVALARALAETARPGTTCISDAVRRALEPDFEESVEDQGLKRIGPEGSEVHVYLIVPGLPRGRGAGLPRRTVVAGIASAAALAVVAVLVLQRRRPVPRSGGALTLGVMQFKCPGADPTRAWICDAVRDGLNTQLTELSDLRVYSREFIDFLVTRQGLTEIEVANKLGLEKLLTGSVAIVEGTVRVETQIVDVESGVIEAAYTITRQQADILGLRDDVVRGAIEKLDVPITPDDLRRMAERRTTDSEALRRLRESEGAAPPSTPTERLPSPEPSSWFGPRPAFAADDEAARAEIVAFLERYRTATQARDVETLATMYTTFAPEQREALVRYFASVRDLRVTIDKLELAVVGDEAVVSYSRTDDFVDVETGRTLHVTTRLTKTLRRVDGGWKLGAGR